MKDKVFLKKVDNNQLDFEVLYELLKNRKFNISNKKTPSFKDHIKFVKKNSYRAWYLAMFNNDYVGSIYLKNDNSIGINFKNKYRNKIPFFLEKILNKHKPLKKIPSERNGNFFINIANGDEKTKKILLDFGLIHIQSTFLIK
tara:strand:+ start:1860 stop:2288 length:429 start_codon:yes stop_codon:yes gene_type:complete